MSAQSASRNRLQEDPGIVRDFPQIGTKLSPHLGTQRAPAMEPGLDDLNQEKDVTAQFEHSS